MNNHYSWDEISLISSDSQSNLQYPSVQFSSVAQSCPTLCDPINRSMPGLPVHHQLPEFTQTHVQHLLISWLQSPSAVIWETTKIKSDTVSTLSPSISHEVMGPDAMIFVFWMLSFKPTFSLSSFTFIKRLLSSSSLYAICISEVIDISPGNLDSSLCFFQPRVSHDVVCIEVE